MDYKRLGLKCGLEIHQQLDTKHKLFCNCSARFEDKEPVFEVKRKLRAVAGEMGKVDIAARHEFLKDRMFRYKVYKNETCSVELDEEPPHPINREALEIALQVAMLLNCEIPEEIHVMRKTVLDGSNTSGFQRTALVGLNGWMKTSFGKLGITNVSLEEDAAQIIKKTKKSVIYGLNRLGIPLVEIGTSPDIHAPEDAKEVAEKIGMVLRSTEKVKRGIGTIRQDLNISIAKGARCEIKGVQKLTLLPKIVEIEVQRQKAVINSGRKVTHDVRKALLSGRTEFLRPLPGAARMYPETDTPPIAITDRMLEKIRKSLPELILDKQDRLVKKYKLNKEVANQIIKAGKTELFEKLAKLSYINTAVNVITRYSKQFRVPDQKLIELFSAIKDRRIPKESLESMLEKLSKGKSVKEVTAKGLPEAVSEEEIRSETKAILESNKGLTFGAYMGLLMNKFKGKADGKTIAKVLKEELRG